MRAFIRKFVPKKLLPLYEKYEDILLYLFFGVLTTIVSFATQYLAMLIFHNAAIDTAISWVCAVTFSYFTNRIWVFEAPTNGKKEFLIQFLKFYGARVFSFLVELLIMWGFVTMMKFPEMIVKIFAQIIILVLNFVLSKFMVFTKKKKDN